ncbi:uncharacterized protein V6R79_003486 [Siganus canaliculatus]
MTSSYGSLVKEAIVLLDKFTTGRQCLDDFVEDASKNLQNMDTSQKEFIIDLVAGCAEHKKLLDIVVNAFYGQNGKCIFRKDRNQFVIVCYLATFALDDLGLKCFSSIVKSLDIKMIQKFLDFFFTNLNTWIQDEWSTVYDAAYVEKQWIGPLLRWRPQINILIQELAESHLKKAPIKTSKPQEFSITKPKPPPPPEPEPELIPQQQKYRPVPNSTYRVPKEMQKIEELKQQNQQKVQELLYESNMKQFKCVNTQKSEHTQKVIAQIQEESDSKLKFNSVYSSGAPTSIKTNWRTKLNNAAILRQRALLDRQVEEEVKRLERLEEGAREPSSFLRWQKEMREKDLQEELVKSERRRLEGLIGPKEPPMTLLVERNKKIAQMKREESSVLMQTHAEKRLQEEKKIKDVVQQVAEGHKNSKAAKEKLQKFKQSIVKEVSEQNQELLRKALEEEQAELSRRYEIICEIHAIESLPHVKITNFDATEVSIQECIVSLLSHVMLGEIDELRERLAIRKEMQQAELQEKREHILEEKRHKKQLHLQQLDTINFHRRMQAQAAAVRKEEKKTWLGVQQAAVAQDETVLALRRKLEGKRQERQKLKQTESKKAHISEQAAADTARTTATHNGVSQKP